MNYYNNITIKFTHGPAASNAYAYINININTILAQLTFDWSCDSVYFKFKNNEWLTINLDDYHNINNISDDKGYQRYVFKALVNETLNKMSNEPLNKMSNETTNKLNENTNKLYNMIECLDTISFFD
jgi:hypothetical protein